MWSCSSGGGGSKNGGMEPEEATLFELGDLLRSAAGGGKVPQKVADLARLEPTFTRSYQAVKSGETIVIWGVPMSGEGDMGKADGSIVAYEKNAATAGGWALLNNGKVKKVSAADIASASKGKK